MEDRALKHLGHSGGVRARPSFLRRRGEPDLVVDDDMDRAARRVTLQLAHVERLLDHAFASECRVAVDQEN